MSEQQSAENDAAWPTDQEWADLTFAADVLRDLCDCGVPEGESESTDPRDRSVYLPHHFDCAAVTTWRALADAGYRSFRPSSPPLVSRHTPGRDEAPRLP